jgi:hypothetical protein
MTALQTLRRNEEWKLGQSQPLLGLALRLGVDKLEQVVFFAVPRIVPPERERPLTWGGLVKQGRCLR